MTTHQPRISSPNVVSAIRPGAGAILAAALLLASAADAQVPPIMSPGDTVVTGFSGYGPAVPPFPSGDPLDETFIDLDRPSLAIQRPQPSGPPAGQLIPSPTVFSVNARAVGQVFAITMDDFPAPNIYVAATSAYGIEIVLPDADADGRPERIATGQPGATFMDGQWGAGGFPGSVYRIDGTTGAVTLFTTIGSNTGPGIGDVVFDRSSRQFFISDLDTGLVYRLTAGGFIVSTFDHGTTARPAMGLPAVPDDGSVMNVQNPAFDTDDPATWGFTQPERRVWGMTVHSGRLYYAVGDTPSVWSVGIRLDGTFAADPRWEFDVDDLAAPFPVTDMVFDGQGRLILAQRGDQTDSYDYAVFAAPQQASVARYQREFPDDPATPGYWVPVPDTYAVGFRPNGANANGGVALGYGYDDFGRMIEGSCGEYLWSTGESLRENFALQTFLAEGGPAIVHGLQGNHHNLVRPANDPPVTSYFTDVDGTFADPQHQGHLGDVEIWQPCGGGFVPPYTPPFLPPPDYTPPPIPEIDLALEKEAVPEICVPGGAGYLCGYTVRVTNVGTIPYWGAVNVTDWLPANPPGTSISIHPSPPWVCAAIGPTAESCSLWPVLMWPGDSVDFYVIADVPADADLCHLTNGATITWPPGTGDADPSNDFDFATAQVPDPDCVPPPDDDDRTNLELIKSAPSACQDIGSHWLCTHYVAVYNRGPGVYNGDIVIEDTMSVASPIIYAPSPPWTCVSAGPVHTCTYPNASLGVNVPVMLAIGAQIPKAQATAQDICDVVNDAEILVAPGGSPKNTNPADDADSATAQLPADHCLGDDPGPIDLSIDKFPMYCVDSPGAFIESKLCYFAIYVRNESGDPFLGNLIVHDTFVGFSPLGLSASHMACGPAGGGLDCTFTPIFIAGHGSFGPLTIGVVVPNDGQTCEITNRATIDAPPGGSPQNTNPGNDSSQVVMSVPFPHCLQAGGPPLPQEPACPPQRQMPGGDCCPEGAIWNGQSCGDGDAPPPPPPDVCPPGTFGIPPNCIPTPRERPECPPGTVGTPPNCVTPLPDECPPGTIGTPPNCRPQQTVCPPGTVGTPPNCVTPLPDECPPGTFGTPPNCRPQQTVCPPGTVGTPPNCVTPLPDECPPGTIGTPPNCRPQQTVCPPGTVGTPPNCITPLPDECPPGTIGTPPNCRPQQTVCPPGTVGTPPNCITPLPDECPPGTIGTPPNCNPTTTPQRVCPPGTVGTPPNCIQRLPDQCPPGTVGTPPNCSEIQTPQRVCPAGTVGTWPNCIERLPETPPGGQEVPETCPPGTTGTPPNCRSVLQLLPGLQRIQPQQEQQVTPQLQIQPLRIAPQNQGPTQTPTDPPAQLQLQQQQQQGGGGGGGGGGCPPGTVGVFPLCLPK